MILLPVSDRDHNPILYWIRIAVRPRVGAPWQWFDAPVALRLSGQDAAYEQIEDQCADAVFRYPTHHIRLVQSPTLEGFDRMDMSQDA